VPGTGEERNDVAEVASSGLEALDALLGGLYWGDNVVWEVAATPTAAPFYAAAAAAPGYDGRIAIRVAGEAVPAAGLEVLDASPGRDLAKPAPLLRAIAARCEPGERNLLLFDGFEHMVASWGSGVAAQFFARCCPQLLDLGAVAYWTIPSGDEYPTLRRTIEDVTQCIFVLTDDRLRIAKAEGRPPRVQGSILRVELDGGTPRLTPAPIASRIGTALRAARLSRQLSQADLAGLAGVTPSAISQAERGHRGLSLETLLVLAGGLNLTLDELLSGEPPAGYQLGRRQHPRRRGGDGSGLIPLLDDPKAGLRAYLVRVPPRGEVGAHLTHKGLELVAVAVGLVQVVLATGRPVLRTGEVLLAEESAVEGWRNLGSTEAQLFWVLRDPRRKAD
jgi:transcriptional regulator with XRE-family HTH domain